MENEDFVKLTTETCDRYLAACRELGEVDEKRALQAMLHRIQFEMIVRAPGSAGH